jgi:hypothetical protein
MFPSIGRMAVMLSAVVTDESRVRVTKRCHASNQGVLEHVRARRTCQLRCEPRRAASTQPRTAPASFGARDDFDRPHFACASDDAPSAVSLGLSAPTSARG